MLSVEELPTIFSDLKPIPQDDGDAPVCVIAYPAPFTMAYNYMRAVWKQKEFSDRALNLTTLCLQLNPANYTVWHFRRQCLMALDRHDDIETIQTDLSLASKLGGDNPKNYQIWYHRRALLEACQANEIFQSFVQGELEYISNVLKEDGKNYHAWSHRQWIIKTMDDEQFWSTELEFASTLIQDDPRNNSAWNQRWFASHRGKKSPLSLTVAKVECDFAVDKGAKLDPFNESPWRYLIGVLKEQQRSNTDLSRETITELMGEYYTKVEALRSTLLETTNKGSNLNPDACTNWTSARIDLLELKGDKESLETSISLAETLATEHDPIRKKYWMFRVDQTKLKVSGAVR